MKIGWILRKCDKFVYLFCPNTGTKFRESYHSNQVIPHRDFQVTSGDKILGVDTDAVE